MKHFIQIALSLAIILNGYLSISFIKKNRQLRGLLLESQALSGEVIEVAKYWKAEAESYRVGGGFQIDRAEAATNRVYFTNPITNRYLLSGILNDPINLPLTNLSCIKFRHQTAIYFIPETNWPALSKMFHKYLVTNEAVTFRSYDY